MEAISIGNSLKNNILRGKKTIESTHLNSLTKGKHRGRDIYIIFICLAMKFWFSCILHDLVYHELVSAAKIN